MTEDEALFERIELHTELMPERAQALSAWLLKPTEDQVAVHLTTADVSGGAYRMLDEDRPMHIPLPGVAGVLAMARQVAEVAPHLQPGSFGPGGVAVLGQDDILIAKAIRYHDGETICTLESEDGEAICAVPIRHAALFAHVLEAAEVALADMGLAPMPARAAN